MIEPYKGNFLVDPLIDYHEMMSKRLFSPFHPHLGTVEEIAIRVGLLFVSAIAYLALGVGALFGVLFHESINRTFYQMKFILILHVNDRVIQFSRIYRESAPISKKEKMKEMVDEANPPSESQLFWTIFSVPPHNYEHPVLYSWFIDKNRISGPENYSGSIHFGYERIKRLSGKWVYPLNDYFNLV